MIKPIDPDNILAKTLVGEFTLTLSYETDLIFIYYVTLSSITKNIDRQWRYPKGLVGAEAVYIFLSEQNVYLLEVLINP